MLFRSMDEGVVTSSNGKKADARNSIVIMTSNLGAAENERKSIGFGSIDKTDEDDRAVKDFFKPEFRNRLDGICKFRSLDQLSMKKIVVKFINELNELLSDRHIKIKLTEAAVDHLAKVGYDPKMGARPLARKITDLIKVPLSRRILFENIAENSVIVVHYQDEAITFTTVAAQPALIDANGYVILEQS